MMGAPFFVEAYLVGVQLCRYNVLEKRLALVALQALRGATTAAAP